MTGNWNGSEFLLVMLKSSNISQLYFNSHLQGLSPAMHLDGTINIRFRSLSLIQNSWSQLGDGELERGLPINQFPLLENI